MGVGTFTASHNRYRTLMAEKLLTSDGDAGNVFFVTFPLFSIHCDVEAAAGSVDGKWSHCIWLWTSSYTSGSHRGSNKGMIVIICQIVLHKKSYP